MPSHQPTHHGFAVNVKDYSHYDLNRGPLSDDDVQTIYERTQEDFWTLVQDVGHEHGFREVYSDGRSSGYAVPQPQPMTDDMWEHELAAWVEDKFRPFERDVLALMHGCIDEFTGDLAEAVAAAEREPVERAYWEARDVETVA
jgi:hypothetical protein